MAKRITPQKALAKRICQAMDEADLTLTALSDECDVTLQAVSQWRTTGRVAKHHLPTIAKATGKSLEFFLLDLAA